MGSSVGVWYRVVSDGGEREPSAPNVLRIEKSVLFSSCWYAAEQTNSPVAQTGWFW